MCLALVAIKSWVFFVLHTRPLNCCQKKKTEPTLTHTPIIHSIRHQLFITMSLLLLETLQEGLEDEYVQLLNLDSSFAQDAEKYLQELLVNDDLLSTDPYTTASGD